MWVLCALGGLSVTANAQDFGSFVSPGELADAHAEVRGLTNCVACHEVGVGLSPVRCMVCHDTVRDQVDAKRGFHGDKGTGCEDCHADHRGRNFQMVTLSEDDFDHTETGFALEGAHHKAECSDCHTDDSWQGLEPTCVPCHDDPHGAAKSDHQLLADCEACHGVDTWDNLPLSTDIFDHTDDQQVAFVLEGRHRKVECEECHEDMRFLPTKAESCASCHEDMHRGQFRPRTCDQCHSVKVAKWALRRYPHDDTDFPLVGQHKSVRCESCHGDKRKARYVDLPHERCDTCHEDPHGGQFLPRDCDACHSIVVAGFAMANFDHDQTDFPLKGAHTDVICEDCHGTDTSQGYAGVTHDDCSSCHEDPHQDDFAPKACSSCHQETSWDVASFDHDLTDYPLEGGHLEVACEDCHGAGDDRQLKGIDHSTCASCHGTADPHEDHFDGERCASCHQIEAWKLRSFDHDQQTDFALVGEHEPLPCLDCHVELSFPDVEAACASCHAQDAPEDHFAGGCETCHVPTGWRFATLGPEGHAVTGFPLVASHRAVACTDCHRADAPRGQALTTCSSCHASEDPHRHLLGDRCESCHTPRDWMRPTFRHTTTGWPLRGIHRAMLCEECHAGGFAGTPRDCGSCHAGIRPNTAAHSGPQSFQCDTCHRPYSWDTVRFPH